MLKPSKRMARMARIHMTDYNRLLKKGQLGAIVLGRGMSALAAIDQAKGEGFSVWGDGRDGVLILRAA